LFHITKISTINPVRFQDVYRVKPGLHNLSGEKQRSLCLSYIWPKKKKMIKQFPPCSNAFSENYWLNWGESYSLY